MNTTETTPNEAPEAVPPSEPAEKVELVRKVYVKDLRPNDRLLTVFRVTRKQKNVGRSGKAFLAISLADRTGEVDARIFDQVDRFEPAFAVGDYVLVQGDVITFHGRPQVLIASVERLDPEPIDEREFTPLPEPRAEERPEGSRVVAQIRDIVERVADPYVKRLLLAFLDDPEIAPGLPVAPAAKGVHHAYKGGLAEHVLSVMKLAHRVADHYPMADRDLLVAGALLHDICKVKELSYEKSFEYTDEGRLVGHLVMTAQKIRQHASRIEGFPPLLEQHITHLVLAHHGRLEYGSPKLPMTLEALLVHLIDEMDSRVASWLEIMARDPNDRWTDAAKLYNRHLWKGPVPTVRNRPPVEGRRKKEKRREGRPARAERAERSERTERVERTEAALPDRTEAPAPEKPRDAALPKDLTFKPFSVLTGEASEGADGGGMASS